MNDVVNNYTPAQLQALLNDDDIITLNELPLMPWSNAAPSPATTTDDGTVDAADYVVWRNSLGPNRRGPRPPTAISTTRSTLADYNIWKAHFGATAGTFASSTSLNGLPVPEPSAGLLLLIGLPYLNFVSRKGAKAQRGHMH